MSTFVPQWRLVVPFGCSMLLAAVAMAQPPGFGRPSPDQIFGMLDTNQDGTIDNDELARSRFPLKQRLEDLGIDTKKGVKKEHLAKMFEAREAEDRSRGEESGRGEDRGRGDSGRGEDRGRGDYGRGDYGRGDYGRGDYGRGDSGRRDDRRDSKSSEGSTPIKIRIALPDAFKVGDVDLDGQIALYEWLQWKGRSLREEFRRMDVNGDGILSPAEIVNPPAAPTATDGASGASTAGAPVAMASGGKGSYSRSAPSSGPAPAASGGALDENDPTVQRARYVFGLMDSDHDGAVSPQEWEKSKSVRPKFEAAGIDLSKPMDADTFARNYVVAYAKG